MMDKEELKQFIQQEIAAIAFVKVGYGDTLLSSNTMDSIAVVDLIVSIEEKIGKKIPQHLLVDENFDSIDKIVETVEKLY